MKKHLIVVRNIKNNVESPVIIPLMHVFVMGWNEENACQELEVELIDWFGKDVCFSADSPEPMATCQGCQEEFLESDINMIDYEIDLCPECEQSNIPKKENPFR